MSPALLSPIGMPCLGQCLDVGRGSKDEDCGHCLVTGTCRQNLLEHCMQAAESSCAHEKPSAK